MAGYWLGTQPYLDEISSFDDLVLAQYGHHTLNPPCEGGVVHIDDSANSTSPQFGQGANMAMLHAKALTVSFERDETVKTAIAHYAALRRRHVQLTQSLSLALTPLYQSDGALIQLMRDNLVLKLAKDSAEYGDPRFDSGRDAYRSAEGAGLGLSHK